MERQAIRPEVLNEFAAAMCRFSDAMREAAASLNRQSAQIHDAMNWRVSLAVLRGEVGPRGWNSPRTLSNLSDGLDNRPA